MFWCHNWFLIDCCSYNTCCCHTAIPLSFIWHLNCLVLLFNYLARFRRKELAFTPAIMWFKQLLEICHFFNSLLFHFFIFLIWLIFDFVLVSNLEQLWSWVIFFIIRKLVTFRLYFWQMTFLMRIDMMIYVYWDGSTGVILLVSLFLIWAHGVRCFWGI